MCPLQALEEMTFLIVAVVLRYDLLYGDEVQIDHIEFCLQIEDRVEVALELGRSICYEDSSHRVAGIDYRQRLHTILD